jgi:hypothetical protein
VRRGGARGEGEERRGEGRGGHTGAGRRKWGGRGGEGSEVEEGMGGEPRTPPLLGFSFFFLVRPALCIA